MTKESEHTGAEDRDERSLDRYIDKQRKNSRKNGGPNKDLNPIKGYVVFLDILGSTRMVMKDAKSGFVRLDNLFTEVQDLLYSPSYEGIVSFTDFVAVFDNVVFAYEGDSFKLFMRMLSDFLIRGLKSGLMIRGAVAHGTYISKNDMENYRSIITGEAYLEAYHLEESVANYPRIVFSKSVDLNGFEEKATDRDGVVFLDFLKFDDLLKEGDVKEISDTLNRYREELLGPDRTKFNRIEEIKADGKYEWMLNYLKGVM